MWCGLKESYKGKSKAVVGANPPNNFISTVQLINAGVKNMTHDMT